ncbi:hypothetical protein BV22DRAFT_974300, partial [Leucogyrophana mollusca]
CAVLSTHDLVRVRYNASDAELWRQMHRTQYWLKETWIIPIHRPSSVGHWVLCVANCSMRQLHLFDSYAERKMWRGDVKVS